MAQRNIDFGTFPDDPNADAIRTAFQKVQENFTELYSGLQEQAVLSVNKTQGAGVTVNSPTGNVVITANIACVTVTSNTLSVGRDSNNSGLSGGTALITSSAQTIVIDLPNDIANIDNVNISDTFTGTNANLSGNLTALNANVTNFVASTANISSTLNVTGNANVGNIGATSGVFSGQVTVSNTLSASNVYANSGTIGANTGSFTGNITAGNANLGNTVKANYFVGDGTGISNVVAVPGPKIENGGSNVVVALNGNVTTTVNGFITQVITATGANITGYATVTGELTANNANLGNSVTANYFVGRLYGAANTATSATTSGTVTTNAQPNITSVGTLTSLGVNGTVTATAFTANTGVFTGNGSGLSALNGSNVTGTVANATYAVTAGTSNSVDGANVSGTVANATYAVSAGSATTAVTANSVAGSNVSGTVANATYATTAGTSNSVDGANVSGTVANATYAVSAGSATTAVSATTAGTVTTAAQPNITSVGNLTALTVTGNILSSNVYANSGIIKAQYLIGDGSNLTNISVSTGSYIINGNSEVRIDANSSVRVNVAGNANVLVINSDGANINGYVNVTGNITAGNVSATNVSGTLLTGTLTTASQPNITSLGNLTSLKVNGVSNLGPNSNVIITGGSNNQFLLSDGNGGVKWVTPANVTTAPGSNTNIIFNDNGSINAVAGLSFNKASNALTVSGNANVGNIGAHNGVFTTIAGTLTTAAQPNITSVGTLTSLIVGNVNAGNITVGQGTITANVFSGNGSSLSNIPGSSITGTVANATYAVSAGSTTETLTRGAYLTGNNFNGSAAATWAVDATSAATANKVVARDANGSFSANVITATLSGNSTYATTSGTAGIATTAGTVTTAAQPNITSVGSLTGLTMAANANITLSGNGVITGNGSGLSALNGSNVTGTVANATYAVSAGTASTANTTQTLSNGGYITGGSFNGGTARTWAVDATTTSTANKVVARDANGSFSANIITANLSGTATSATTATAADNINTSNVVTTGNRYFVFGSAVTSSSQLPLVNSAFVANFSNGSITATTFVGDLSGTATSATTATTASTVTTAAQPNITSVGTLTSLTSSGNISGANVIASSYHIRSVGTGISANGTTQGTATQLSKEINVVSTVASGAGVILPVAVAGMVITIVNTSANALLVYPHVGGDINGAAANTAFSQPAKATLQFIVPNTTDWYTVGATYA